MSVLRFHQLTKGFDLPGGGRREILDIPSFVVNEGETVALVGGSGSGKTTLLHLASGVLLPDRGSIEVDGVDITQLEEASRDRLRASTIGYVFQQFHLLPQYSALENVLLGMAFGGGVDPKRATALLVRLGLKDRLHDRPQTLSFGQRQRVAVARALANRPRLVLADEPTGNLDLRHAREAVELLIENCSEEGAALVMVTHDPRAMDPLDQTIELSSLNRTSAEDAGGVA